MPRKFLYFPRAALVTVDDNNNNTKEDEGADDVGVDEDKTTK
jgi:hypothetical protein